MKKLIENLKIDKFLLVSILVLLFMGISIFLSASLGILASDQLKFFTIIKSQLIYVFILGIFALYIGSQINYKYYKKYSIILFVLSIIGAFLVFVPGLGFYYNGAKRWIHIFSISIQPSELIKLTGVIVTSFYVSTFKKKFSDYKYGLLPFAGFIIIVAGTLLIQRDFGTLLIILSSSFMVYLVGGARWKDMIILALIGLVSFFILIEMRPYMKERILTFVEPDRELLGAGYQLNQSLIAVGSGQIFGRGIGQSIQKFNYLPEQISDSIFPVFAEEAGFFGSVILIIVFTIIIFRGIYIAKYTNDDFGKLVTVGILSIFFFQSFLNIASSIGVAPLTGVPLPLISKGGTSLVFFMFEFGILLNISKYRIKI